MIALGVLQARLSSSRLPGKVLRPLLGEPMLLRQIERVRRSKVIGDLVVATSSQPEDDAIAALCQRIGVRCMRGSLDDVLDRFYRAAAADAPEHVVRLTGDCPLADPELIDAIVGFHRNGGFDYSSNCLPPTFPDGLDVEAVRFDVLEAAWREAALPSEREHVMPFIWRRPERFRLGNFENPAGDQSWLRWTVDEASDFELVTRIYEALYPANAEFGTREIMALLERQPDLATLNTHHPRNEGLLKSLAADQAAQSAERELKVNRI